MLLLVNCIFGSSYRKMASCLMIRNQNSCWSVNLVLSVKHQTSSKESSIQEHHLLVNFTIWSSVRASLHEASTEARQVNK